MRYAARALAPLALAPAARAQTAADSARARQLRASWERHKGDFDYLLGDWTFTAQSKQWGRFHGLWSAVRLEGGGPILDEYRITGDSGQTFYVSTTLRSYNAAADRWELVSVDDGTGLRNIGTAHLAGGEMHIEQTFDATGSSPAQWRIRYYDIQPERFSWAADRSTDGGRTWVTDYLRIEARRAGPPKPAVALAPAHGGGGTP